MLTDVSDEAGEATADAITVAAGGRACYVHADVSKEADAKAMIGRRRHAIRRAGRALQQRGGDAWPRRRVRRHLTAEAVWDTRVAMNVKGVRLRLQVGDARDARHRWRVDHQRGLFVAWMGAATSQTAYTASKGAVLAMTREIAVEYARRGIRVQRPLPRAGANAAADEAPVRPRRSAATVGPHPHGPPRQRGEIAKAALFLARDDSSFMTGASLIVDGGITAAYVTPED